MLDLKRLPSMFDEPLPTHCADLPSASHDASASQLSTPVGADLVDIIGITGRSPFRVFGAAAFSFGPIPSSCTARDGFGCGSVGRVSPLVDYDNPSLSTHHLPAVRDDLRGRRKLPIAARKPMYTDFEAACPATAHAHSPRQFSWLPVALRPGSTNHIAPQAWACPINPSGTGRVNPLVMGVGVGDSAGCPEICLWDTRRRP